ncbi:MAG: hypothetical protein Q9183_007376, partial [Haloplaca sp. 2 TL-2023]
MVERALQYARSAPAGPVYLVGAREVMEEDIEPYTLNQAHWQPLGPAALPEEAVHSIGDALLKAQEPLLITGYSGRNHSAVCHLEYLANVVTTLRVLDTGGSDMCFPANHPASLGLRYGVHDRIKTADVILVIDCDVPWIPTQCKPSPSCRIFHIDSDPLKQQIPVFYIPAEGRWKVDSCVAIRQLNMYLSEALSPDKDLAYQRGSNREHEHEERITSIRALGHPPQDTNSGYNVSQLTALLRSLVPSDTIFAVEAVTLTQQIHDQLLPSLPGTYINCGGGGLGWSGGAALGIKLAAGESKFVCQIVGDGTFLFSVPGSVYWIAQKYSLP